jgi:hypothetical protein
LFPLRFAGVFTKIISTDGRNAMNNSRCLLCICFCAGVFAALISSGAAWMAGNAGLPQWLGVKLVPAWSGAWIHPRLVWGGLWGLFYYTTVSSPRGRIQWMRKGLWVSLLPCAWQLFFVFPNRTDAGMLGLGLGTLTPLFILFYNLIWGATTGIFARAFYGRSR